MSIPCGSRAETPRRVPSVEVMVAEALRDGMTLDELLDSGPGALEGNHPRAAANAIAFLASQDTNEECGDVASPVGHVARIERWLVRTDDRGFISVIEYDTIPSAGQAYRDLEVEHAEWSEREI